MKAIFKNDYSWKSGYTRILREGEIGGAPNTIDFKKGDALTGLSLTLSEDKKQVISNMGNFKIGIPVENLTILNDDGTPESGSMETLPPAIMPPPTKLTAEDKFYEKLGIKYSDSGWGIKSRPMGRILVLGVLIASYFAYKKFNK
jgi:hypothetical protein